MGCLQATTGTQVRLHGGDGCGSQRPGQQKRWGLIAGGHLHKSWAVKSHCVFPDLMEHNRQVQVGRAPQRGNERLALRIGKWRRGKDTVRSICRRQQLIRWG